MNNVNIDGINGEDKGLDLLARTKLATGGEAYLIATPSSDESAIGDGRLGATDCFERPVDLKWLENNIENFVHKNNGDWDLPKTAEGSLPKTAEGSLSKTAEGSACTSQCGVLVGNSAAMHQLYRLLCKVAPTEVAVFLVGESGSGKELAAQTIHQLSNRKHCPFVAVNCGAIARELIESELFGHVKGAFTGATRSHAGFFERSEGGTLFLDEVTEMPTELQVKLLRVLEAEQIRPVGGEQDYPVDVRIIASTNRDPEEAVACGILRQDLYYRLAQFPIRIPPLRERGEDIELIAENFLAEQNKGCSPKKAFASDTLDLLRLHDWPGNIRELKNVVSRAYILAGEQIETGDLPANIPSASALSGDFLRISVGQSLSEVERRMIFATLEHFEGDKKATANALGVSLKTLYNRIKYYRVYSRSE